MPHGAASGFGRLSGFFEAAAIEGRGVHFGIRKNEPIRMGMVRFAFHCVQVTRGDSCVERGLAGGGALRLQCLKCVKALLNV